MTRIKKIISFIIIGILAVGLLSACGKGQQDGFGSVESMIEEFMEGLKNCDEARIKNCLADPDSFSLSLDGKSDAEKKLADTLKEGFSKIEYNIDSVEYFSSERAHVTLTVKYQDMSGAIMEDVGDIISDALGGADGSGILGALENAISEGKEGIMGGLNGILSGGKLDGLKEGLESFGEELEDLEEGLENVFKSTEESTEGLVRPEAETEPVMKSVTLTLECENKKNGWKISSLGDQFKGIFGIGDVGGIGDILGFLK